MVLDNGICLARSATLTAKGGGWCGLEPCGAPLVLRRGLGAFCSYPLRLAGSGLHRLVALDWAGFFSLLQR